ncbi:MAG: TIGR03086 family metal-binding protein [Acidimicrobiia bacterium]
MTQIETLEFALDQLTAVVASLDGSQMDTATNCEPWTVRQLVSHAVNNQLFWAGMVTGEEIVSVEDTMSAVPYEGDLAPVAQDAAARSLVMWSSEGVLGSTHATPFGDLPGSMVINFPTVDALVHSWDLSASVGDAIEFAPAMIPTVSAVVDITCTDGARAAGLILPATEPPADATDTERLMAAAGRTIPR